MRKWNTSLCWMQGALWKICWQEIVISDAGRQRRLTENIGGLLADTGRFWLLVMQDEETICLQRTLCYAMLCYALCSMHQQRTLWYGVRQIGTALILKLSITDHVCSFVFLQESSAPKQSMLSWHRIVYGERPIVVVWGSASLFILTPLGGLWITTTYRTLSRYTLGWHDCRPRACLTTAFILRCGVASARRGGGKADPAGVQRKRI